MPAGISRVAAAIIIYAALALAALSTPRLARDQVAAFLDDLPGRLADARPALGPADARPFVDGILVAAATGVAVSMTLAALVQFESVALAAATGGAATAVAALEGNLISPLLTAAPES